MRDGQRDRVCECAQFFASHVSSVFLGALTNTLSDFPNPLKMSQTRTTDLGLDSFREGTAIAIKEEQVFVYGKLLEQLFDARFRCFLFLQHVPHTCQIRTGAVAVIVRAY